MMMALHASADANPDSDPASCNLSGCASANMNIGNDQIELICVRYDFPAEGQSTWFYKVTSGNRPAISHVVFSLSLDCLSVLDAGTWGQSTDDLNSGQGQSAIHHNPDPTTGVVGLKFDQGFNDGESRQYYFTLNGNYNLSSSVLVASKGGPGFDSGMICGPSTDCSIVLTQDCPAICAVPTGVQAGIAFDQLGFYDADPGSFSPVVVSWEENDCAAGWRVCARNTLSAELTCKASANAETLFEQLIPGMTYQIAVRAKCSAGNKSDWSEPITYTVPFLRMPEPAKTAGSEWKAWPSPASDRLMLDWQVGVEHVDIRLQDLRGRLQKEMSIHAQGEQGHFEIATEMLAEGMYVLTLMLDGHAESRLISIQR